jgi:DNA-binding NarL/FixJ family response regulator
LTSASLEQSAIVVALSDVLLASALTGAISESFSVIISVGSWHELEDLLDRHSTCVVVMDLAVGRDSVVPHVAQLAAHYPSSRFVICTTQPDPVLIGRLLLCGVAGVIGHDLTVGELATLIRATSAGEPWPDGVGSPAVPFSRQPPPLKPLSPRLRQVAELLWQGKSHAVVSKALGLSVKTIESHASKIRHAYGVPRGMPGPWEGRRRGRGMAHDSASPAVGK